MEIDQKKQAEQYSKVEPKKTQHTKEPDRGTGASFQRQFRVALNYLLIYPLASMLAVFSIVAIADYFVNDLRSSELIITETDYWPNALAPDDNTAWALFADADLFDLKMYARYADTSNLGALPPLKNGEIPFSDNIQALLAGAITELVSFGGGEPELGYAPQNGRFFRIGDSVFRFRASREDGSVFSGGPNFYAIAGTDIFGALDGPSAVPNTDSQLNILESAIISTLIKADDHEYSELIFYALDDAITPAEDVRLSMTTAFQSVRPYLTHLSSVSLHILNQSTSETIPNSTIRNSFLPSLALRRLFIRRPMSNRSELYPLRAIELPKEYTSFDDATSLTSFPPTFFLPSISLENTRLILPLLAGYLVYFLTVSAGVFYFGWKKRKIIPLKNRLYALSICALIPIVYSFFAWQSWANPLNWDPLKTPATTPIWWIYAVILSAGVFAGLGLFFRTFLAEREVESKKETSVRAMIKHSVYTDNPVSDAQTEDRLGFKTLVLALANLFDNKDTLPPLVASVNGPWGSGKSSVMRMLQTQLSKTKRFHFAWFNAWEYQKEDEILSAFLRTVSNQLRKDMGIKFAFRMGVIRWKRGSDMQRLTYLAPFLILFGLGAIALTGLSLPSIEGVTDEGGIAAAVAGLMGILGLGGAINSLRWLTPFQKPLLQFIKFSSPNDNGSHIEQFNAEFALFREALRDKKFIVFVDDLDRCSASSVVEILKTINLISSNAQGNGKVFFLLGFDWEFVQSSVEIHYKEFIEQAPQTSDEFGRQYLKKVVTLPVSVPQPSKAKIAEMVRYLEKKSDDESPVDDGKNRFAKFYMRLIPLAIAFLNRPLNLIVLAAIPVALYFLRVAPEVLSPPAREIVSNGGAPIIVGPQVPAETEPSIIINSVPQLMLENFSSDQLILLVAVSVALALLILAALNFANGVFLEQKPPDEPSDPKTFVSAVNDLLQHMPGNPRDVIRLVNIMRISYLVQSDELLDAQQNQLPDMFEGAKFGAETSTKFSLWYCLNASALELDWMEKALLPELEKGTPLAKVTKLDEEKMVAFLATLKPVPGIEACINDAAGFKRFLDVYRHLLKQ